MGKNEYARKEYYKDLMFYEKGVWHDQEYKKDPERFKALISHSKDPFMAETPAVMLTD